MFETSRAVARAVPRGHPRAYRDVAKELTIMGKNIAVFGIYPNRFAVEEAVEHLRKTGFRSTDISVLFQDNQGTKDFAHEKNTKAPEGVTTGVVAGGLAGGVLGWLVGIGALAIPGLGPLIAAGPIVAALAGAGAVGTLGGFVGALAGMGIPEYEAKRYEGRIREGGVLLSVHCDSSDWVKRGKEVLEHTGAQDIASEGEKAGDYGNSDRPGSRVVAAAEGEKVVDYPFPVVPRVRGAGSGGTLTDDDLYGVRTVRPDSSTEDL
jgi:hypothetical protein